MSNKTIKGDYNVVSKMNCEHSLDIIEEEYISEICISIILECQKCKSKFKGILYGE